VAIREVYPYLCVHDGPAAIEFYSRVFGAVVALRVEEPNGRVGHAELSFGPGTVMLADEFPELGILSPRTIGGTGTTIHLHVDDVDSLASRAAAAGAVILRGPTTEGHGERQCRLRDPFGHEWLLGDG
jgi:uncharacterized glyoxalase superfamily protein PhnB